MLNVPSYDEFQSALVSLETLDALIAAGLGETPQTLITRTQYSAAVMQHEVAPGGRRSRSQKHHALLVLMHQQQQQGAAA